ncbi:helix-turn-helix domain-containing protein [Pseudomonas quasicaspiana]|uniref:helix-turn-helix domain-containing protein n=1 Tax=Pseudomonas quasicaspiana TaxID=2829821 RepID=UPI0038739A33|nr:helix-turn-helix transcriptional regulator [Pseudomonas quasicaspiana]
MTIGQRLRHERRAKGMSVRALAILADVRAYAQSRYESGSRLPYADYLSALHELGMDVPYILLGRRTAARVCAPD